MANSKKLVRAQSHNVFLKQLKKESEVTITQYMEQLHATVGDDYDNYEPYDFKSFLYVLKKTPLSILKDVWIYLVELYEEDLREAMEMSEEEEDEAGLELARELQEPVEITTKTSYFLNSSPVIFDESHDYDDLDEEDEYED